MAGTRSLDLQTFLDLVVEDRIFELRQDWSCFAEVEVYCQSCYQIASSAPVIWGTLGAL